jgi:hypothetical protein
MCCLVTQGIKQSTAFATLPVIFANENAVNEANANAPLKSVEAGFYIFLCPNKGGWQLQNKK